MPKKDMQVKAKQELKPWEMRRKQRTRELIQVGGLAEIAGLLTVDRAALLGMMMVGARMLEDEATYDNSFRLGIRMFKERDGRNTRKHKQSEEEGKGTG